MIEIGGLAAQVQRNCRVADARTWGYHSLCGLLIRLRELYKWEKGLEPWAHPSPDEVMPWIGEREGEWEELQEAGLAPLKLDGAQCDPFDVETVNGSVSVLGYHYGAGHGPARKPLFVLGEVQDRRCVEGRNVVVIGRDLVRDLSPFPAMSRDGLVVVRKDALRWYLWQRIEEAGTKPDRSLAAVALADLGVNLAALLAAPAAHAGFLQDLLERETEVVIRHELGELREDEREGPRWGDLLGGGCGSKAEILARALKDCLADTGEGGRLEYVIAHGLAASLAFMASFSEGVHRRLLGELDGVYRRLREDGDWEKVEEARLRIHRRLRGFVEPLAEAAGSGLPRAGAAARIDALEEEMLGAGGDSGE